LELENNLDSATIKEWQVSVTIFVFVIVYIHFKRYFKFL